MADTKKKYDALNIVRALAAIAILVYHYTTRYNDIYGHASTWKINFPHGYFAVSTFFILSGFLTVINLRQNETAYRFLQRRAVRLYPTYWICMLVTTAFCLVLLPEKLIGIKNYLIGLTMLQSAVSVPSVDGAYWTLLHELRFYVFVAVIVLFKWKNLV